MGLGGVAIVILPSIMCLKLTFSDGLGGALVSSAPTKQELHQPSYTAPTKLHYTSFFVGTLETSAPPKETSAPSTTPHLSKIKIKLTITF